MTSDPNKKTTRSFQCREALWQKFEQMARELECSVDYLINDSMKQYARQRGYGATGAGGQSIPPPLVGSASPPSSRPGAPTPPPPPPLVVPPPPPVTSVAPPLPPPVGGSRAAPPPAPPPAGVRPPKRTGPNPVPPPPPPLNATVSRRAPPPLAPSRSIPPPPGAASSKPVPPPPPPMPHSSVPSPPSGALTITYQGEVFQVTKDRFIIGRGKQTSDLTIKDPNVSRQHAMIEFLTGQYYIVDMGSTNGVEYNGQRVQRKVISDGDTFKVCDHELRFSFQ
ncbi:MAG TPA: FHA domain-containing protein [Polyangiaceae bacterium]|nr:FHA domain-containing protein [Polyangiaceae bacterium]